MKKFVHVQTNSSILARVISPKLEVIISQVSLSVLRQICAEMRYEYPVTMKRHLAEITTEIFLENSQ